MKVLIASSEISPVVKTGGLADMVGAMAFYLQQNGIEVALALPHYAKAELAVEPVSSITVPIGDGRQTGTILSTTLPGTEIPLYLIDHDGYFNRPGIYNENGIDYSDNLERFSFFCRAAIELITAKHFVPDIVHCNDWQTALIPVYLKTIPSLIKSLSNIQSIYTIHNLAYQGLFPAEQYPIAGIGWEHFHMEELEYYNQVNLMKGGIVFADAITTVSPSYAQEILTPEFGCGLEGTLRKRKNVLTGILNGVDYSIWSPDKDPYLPHPYSIENVDAGKHLNKKALRERMGMSQTDPDKPIFGVVSRLASQKGLDLLLPLIPKLIELGAQFALLGSGAPKMERKFDDLQDHYPDNFGIYIGYNETIAHFIEAGSDFFIMPSRYEPCGLNQMYSLKYGTIPIVHKIGGLADTIVDVNHDSDGYGFVFEQNTEETLLQACERALAFYRDKNQWLAIVKRAMQQDFSWEIAAKKYQTLYQTLLKPNH